MQKHMLSLSRLPPKARREKGEGRREIYVIAPPFSAPFAGKRRIEEKTKKKMEFFWELLVTAALSFIFAVLLSMLVASASTDSPSSVASAVDLPPQSVSLEKASASVDEAPKGDGDAAVAAENEAEQNSDGGDGVLASGEVGGGTGVGMEREEAVELELKGKFAAEEAEESIEEKEMTLEDRIDREVSVESGGHDAVCENAVEREKENLIVDEEDWEGIERSELEKHFDAVVRSVDSGSAEVLAKVGSDVQMQLYGLHKVATEGPCYDPQPSVLKTGAHFSICFTTNLFLLRAVDFLNTRSEGGELLYVSDGEQWLRCARHAWQKLGNMNPEAAMEQYINLVSDSVPELAGERLGESNEQEEAQSSPEVSSTEKAPDLGSGKLKKFIPTPRNLMLLMIHNLLTKYVNNQQSLSLSFLSPIHSQMKSHSCSAASVATFAHVSETPNEKVVFHLEMCFNSHLLRQDMVNVYALDKEKKRGE
ncbi:hypothetical protein ACLOJK_025664 [Asimina triloba]